MSAYSSRQGREGACCSTRSPSSMQCFRSPREYSISAAYSDEVWRRASDRQSEAITLKDTTQNRALNRAWHVSGLPVARMEKERGFSGFQCPRAAQGKVRSVDLPES